MIRDRLELLVSIQKYLNISAASRERRIGQPAVSRQLRMLQEEMGLTLIRRSGRGIALTPAGHLVFGEVAGFVDRLDEITRSYGRYNETGLTIAGGPGACSNLLPRLMAEFRRRHPATIFNLRTGLAGEVESWLLKQEVDIGVISNPAISPSIRKEPYRMEKRTAFVRPDHPLAGKEIKQTRATSEIDFIVRLRIGERSDAERELRAVLPKDLKLRIAMRCDSPDAVKEAVREGAGVGILFDGVIRRELKQGDFEEVKIPGLEGARHRYIAYRNEDSLSAVAKQFLTFVRNSAAPTLRLDSKRNTGSQAKAEWESHSSRDYAVNGTFANWKLSRFWPMRAYRITLSSHMH
jgi:DNA-binding transcriptional LysR family regulator